MDQSRLETTSLIDLARYCRRETVRFQQGKSSDSGYCLEIFRRALQHHPNQTIPKSSAPLYQDEQARGMLVEIYTEYLRAQVNRSAFQRAEIDDIVQKAWLNFWQAANSGLIFPDLSFALAYLKRVVTSEMIKVRRKNRTTIRAESLQAFVEFTGQEPAGDEEDPAFSTLTRQQFRSRCRELLPEEPERTIFWLRYGLGYPPQEIAQFLNQRAADTGQPLTKPWRSRSVSDRLERCFHKLSLDPEIRDLLTND